MDEGQIIPGGQNVTPNTLKDSGQNTAFNLGNSNSLNTDLNNSSQSILTQQQVQTHLNDQKIAVSNKPLNLPIIQQPTQITAANTGDIILENENHKKKIVIGFFAIVTMGLLMPLLLNASVSAASVQDLYNRSILNQAY